MSGNIEEEWVTARRSEMVETVVITDHCVMILKVRLF